MNPGIFFALARSVEYSPKGSKSFRCTAAPVLSKNLTWRMVAESPELERAPGLSGLALITCAGHQPCPRTRPQTCAPTGGHDAPSSPSTSAGFPGLGSWYTVIVVRATMTALGLAESAPPPAAVAGARGRASDSSSPGATHSMRSAASSTASMSPSSYRTVWRPLFELNAVTRPPKKAPSAGQNTRTRRSMAASPGASLATLTHTAEGRKSRILGLTGREDLRTPAASTDVPPALYMGVAAARARAAAAEARLAAAAASAAGQSFPPLPPPGMVPPAMPSAPQIRLRSHWLLLLVVLRLNAVRNTSCRSFWPIPASSRSRAGSV
mmetsp:Transcript_22683/g.56198  ORF Transcript_22683/g.56198 Transcript_22683/m.56198 type:complete len:324 (-) Transcript_22683:122-1093(-)